jgi:hypothetical protein
MDYARDLEVAWSRLGARVSWARLQPVEDGPIQWNLLAGFENELRVLHLVGIAPIVVIQDTPAWAVMPDVRDDGQTSLCGAIRADKFPKFAQFVQAVVTRYRTNEFNVHNWELGNEPDIDPDNVPPDSGFGCWGDASDPFYGGRHFGEMLKVVSPVLRAADPQARIWIGGLILPAPPQAGGAPGPEQFLRGVLEAGAAAHFDIVPYHWYTSYWQYVTDYDQIESSPWAAWGGGVVGKAAYLRQVMGDYGVNKPVFLNEVAMGCPNDWTSYAWCVNPAPEFYEAQADFLVRSFTRGIGNGVMGFAWYALQDPNWRYTGLIINNSPKPVYDAYHHLTHMLGKATYIGPASYGADIEGYAFRKDGRITQVVWAKAEADTTEVISVPSASFLGAMTRDGAALTATLNGNQYRVTVGFEPVYLLLR